MISVVVYMKYRRVRVNFVRLVELLSECVRLWLDGVTCGWAVGLLPAQAAWWDKKSTGRASSSPTCALEDAWAPEPFLVHRWQRNRWTKGSPIFWLPRARSKQPLPIDSNPSFAVEFCHVLFSWTSKMPMHCTEHQDAFVWVVYLVREKDERGKALFANV